MSKRLLTIAVVLVCWRSAGKAQPLQFPPVGLGHDQTLRVYVHPPSPCIVDVLIAENSGAPVEHLQFTLEGVLISSVSLNGNQVTPSLGARAELIVTVTYMPPAGTGNGCAGPASVEIDDIANATTLAIAPVAVPLGPPQFGPAGMGFLQTVRLNILAHPPGPCYGVLSFQDANGNPIGAPKTVSLSAGTADFLDLTSQTAGVGFLGHAEVQPIFTPAPGTAPSMCTGSVEVFDQLTGWSRTLIPPGP
jgi:hypothetical protein